MPSGTQWKSVYSNLGSIIISNGTTGSVVILDATSKMLLFDAQIKSQIGGQGFTFTFLDNTTSEVLRTMGPTAPSTSYAPISDSVDTGRIFTGPPTGSLKINIAIGTANSGSGITKNIQVIGFG